jgi:hypothetical protein
MIPPAFSYSVQFSHFPSSNKHQMPPS